MPCAATTRCSRPRRGSSGFGRCRPGCSSRPRRCVSTTLERGGLTQFTSSLLRTPGGCPSNESGEIPIRREIEPRSSSTDQPARRSTSMTQDHTDESAVPSEWQSIVSGNAELELSSPPAARVPALQMDYDFKGGGGFVVARRALVRSMPEQYAVKFRLRGRGALNHLELKLVDATGQNVWRHVQKDLRLPQRWTRMRVDSRDIDFAWGPSSGGRLSDLSSMEFAIVAGEGGKGTVWIADVEIEDCSPAEAPNAWGSSSLPDFEAL